MRPSIYLRWLGFCTTVSLHFLSIANCANSESARESDAIYNSIKAGLSQLNRDDYPNLPGSATPAERERLRVLADLLKNKQYITRGDLEPKDTTRSKKLDDGPKETLESDPETEGTNDEEGPTCQDVKYQEDPCAFAQEECESEGLVNYTAMYYCRFSHSTPLFYFLAVVMLLIYFYILYHISDLYLTNTLQQISNFLNMSNEVAGLTLLSFGNSAPDFFTALAGVSSDGVELILSSSMSGGIFVTTLVLGSVILGAMSFYRKKNESREQNVEEGGPNVHSSQLSLNHKPQEFSFFRAKTFQRIKRRLCKFTRPLRMGTTIEKEAMHQQHHGSSPNFMSHSVGALHSGGSSSRPRFRGYKVPPFHWIRNVLVYGGSLVMLGYFILQEKIYYYQALLMIIGYILFLFSYLVHYLIGRIRRWRKERSTQQRTAPTSITGASTVSADGEKGDTTTEVAETKLTEQQARYCIAYMENEIVGSVTSATPLAHLVKDYGITVTEFWPSSSDFKDSAVWAILDVLKYPIHMFVRITIPPIFSTVGELEEDNDDDQSDESDSESENPPNDADSDLEPDLITVPSSRSLVPTVYPNASAPSEKPFCNGTIPLTTDKPMDPPDSQVHYDKRFSLSSPVLMDNLSYQKQEEDTPTHVNPSPELRQQSPQPFEPPAPLPIDNTYKGRVVPKIFIDDYTLSSPTRMEWLTNSSVSSRSSLSSDSFIYSDSESEHSITSLSDDDLYPGRKPDVEPFSGAGDQQQSRAAVDQGLRSLDNAPEITAGTSTSTCYYSAQGSNLFENGNSSSMGDPGEAVVVRDRGSDKPKNASSSLSSVASASFYSLPTAEITSGVFKSSGQLTTAGQEAGSAPSGGEVPRHVPLLHTSSDVPMGAAPREESGYLQPPGGHSLVAGPPSKTRPISGPGRKGKTWRPKKSSVDLMCRLVHLNTADLRKYRLLIFITSFAAPLFSLFILQVEDIPLFGEGSLSLYALVVIISAVYCLVLLGFTRRLVTLSRIYNHIYTNFEYREQTASYFLTATMARFFPVTWELGPSGDRAISGVILDPLPALSSSATAIAIPQAHMDPSSGLEKPQNTMTFEKPTCLKTERPYSMASTMSAKSNASNGGLPPPPAAPFANDITRFLVHLHDRRAELKSPGVVIYQNHDFLLTQEGYLLPSSRVQQDLRALYMVELLLSITAFVLCILWIFATANELVALLQTVGYLMNISDRVLGSTVLAWGNSVGDLFANGAMARAVCGFFVAFALRFRLPSYFGYILYALFALYTVGIIVMEVLFA
ncbi:Mitochondrial sodium/calcium exchanger protein [Dispira simplex]|nr:Mitochondrial sodium/calcium exchanger protein [Dispira simplex]